MESFLNFLNVLAEVAIILGIPLGLYELNRSSRKEQKDREEAVYHALDEKYMSFQRLCLEYPYLDIFDIPDSTPPVLTEKQKKEELIVFTLLFSIFERAYVMYMKTNSKVLRGQWYGWEEYIYDYCKRENFRTAWKISGETFDPRFQLDFVHFWEERIEATSVVR